MIYHKNMLRNTNTYDGSQRKTEIAMHGCERVALSTLLASTRAILERCKKKAVSMMASGTATTNAKMRGHDVDATSLSANEIVTSYWYFIAFHIYLINSLIRRVSAQGVSDHRLCALDMPVF